MTLTSDLPVRGDAPTRVLVVAAASTPADGVRHLRLVDPRGATLPSFTPGSHVVVSCGTDTDGRARRNSYSLTGPELEPDAYEISVRLDPSGRGGSRWIHDLVPGDTVEISRPRSAFAPVLTARHHLLVAGGIGVTPILSHARAAATWGRSFEVHYTFRPGDGPHLDELRELCGDGLHTYHTPGEFWSTVGPALLDRPLGTHLYACGPGVLIDELVARATDAGWPSARIHYEHFGVGALDAGEAFTLGLRRSGIDVPVPAGVSALDALEQHGVAVSNLCRQGVCGECRTPVVGGAPLHRDLFLTASEKDSGSCFMPCVSRADGDRIEVDL
ncbi:PDR/VanB family oxidoreductase [Rhodococcus sp. NPDC003318]|uniref:PDR/VanB family oxidoreductase n=1 Tax=Rhodococcus sp. NPDC003318 TaxID=3364503 RepID=UPI00369959A5